LHLARCPFVLVDTVVAAAAQQPAYTAMVTTSDTREWGFVARTVRPVGSLMASRLSLGDLHHRAAN
jgi:hypothetical protein